MTDREAAWDAVHEALPAGWTVGPPTYDFGVRGWSVTARSLAHRRNRPPQTVTGTGVDETVALTQRRSLSALEAGDWVRVQPAPKSFASSPVRGFRGSRGAVTG